MQHQQPVVARIDFSPGAEYGVGQRLWQGCPTIMGTRSGRLFAGWYSGGIREPSLRNYCLLASSSDRGLSWREPLLVIAGRPEHDLQALDIQLWLDPVNRLWLFWTQRHYDLRLAGRKADPRHLNTWAIVCTEPDADLLVWSEPRFVAPGFLRCQPTVLRDGRWLLCAYDWTDDRYHYYESPDSGQTFRPRQAGRKVPTPFDEAMVLERRDGCLWLLARARGSLGQSFSRDGGRTWTDGEPSAIPNPSTRFFLRRLRSGRVLLINNHDSQRRCNLTAFLSEDEGLNWSASLLLDSRETSYPDAVQAEDGVLHMVYDRGRTTFREIIHSRITEEDILAGHLIDHDSYTGNLVSKAPVHPEVPAAEQERIRQDDDAWRARMAAERFF
ncbi:MAG: sialidase family protein [Lentisphaeria bacterium]|jgi:hypothetical protein|nr:sialidase family protein [Lentisphaeria bacterium]